MENKKGQVLIKILVDIINEKIGVIEVKGNIDSLKRNYPKETAEFLSIIFQQLADIYKIKSQEYNN